MITVDATPAQRILVAAALLGQDELAVLCLVAERLALGKARYGELDLVRDQRDFRHEALEEAADGLVYVAAALLSRGRTT